MNIDEHPQIPGQMGIQSIPAVIAFVDGQPADGFMGAVPGEPGHRLHQQADRGHAGRAQYRGNPQRGRSRSGRGRSRHRRADLCRGAGERRHQYRGARGPREMLRGDRRQSNRPSRRSPWCRNPSATMPAVKAVQASLDLAEQAKSVGPVTELEQKVAANPLDHQARFDLATALNASGKRAEATQAAARRSSSATANGTRTAPASSWCSSSRRGARTTKPPSRDESGCRPFCFRSAHSAKVDTGFAIEIRASLETRTSRPDRRCRSMPNIADPATFPR